MNAKMTQSTSSEEVEPHLRPDGAISSSWDAENGM